MKGTLIPTVAVILAGAGIIGWAAVSGEDATPTPLPTVTETRTYVPPEPEPYVPPAAPEPDAPVEVQREAMHRAWDRLSTSERDDVCFYFAMDEEGALDIWEAQGSLFDRAIVRSFFLGNCP